MVYTKRQTAEVIEGDLKKGIEKAWSEISTDTIEKFFQSMPKRVRQVMHFKGSSCN